MGGYWRQQVVVRCLFSPSKRARPWVQRGWPRPRRSRYPCTRWQVGQLPAWTAPAFRSSPIATSASTLARGSLAAARWPVCSREYGSPCRIRLFSTGGRSFCVRYQQLSAMTSRASAWACSVQARQLVLPTLTTSSVGRRGAWLCLPGHDRLLREPHRQAPALAQGRIVFSPVRDPAPLLGDTMAASSIGLERHRRSRVIGGTVLLRQPFLHANHPICATNSYKAVIGRSLRARMLPAQKTEARVGCAVLNRMTRLGMPVSQRVS